MSSIERVASAGGMGISEAVVITTAEGKQIHISGQIVFDPEVGYVQVKGDVESQANTIFDQMENILAGCGGDLSNVVRVTAYLTSFDEYASYSQVRRERFAGNPPASTSVQVAALAFGATLEVDAVAFVPNS